MGFTYSNFGGVCSGRIKFQKVGSYLKTKSIAAKREHLDAVLERLDELQGLKDAQAADIGVPNQVSSMSWDDNDYMQFAEMSTISI